MAGNSADWAGGGAAGSEGQLLRLNDCTLTGNLAGCGGGVAEATLNNCVLTNNNAASTGGGAWFCELSNCIVIDNSAYTAGGTWAGTLNYCSLIRNSAQNGGGAGAGTLNNCLLIGNSAANSGGGAVASSLTNCTVIRNSAGASGGGVGDWFGPLNPTPHNCILYFNIAAQDANFYDDYTLNEGYTLSFCCTTPMPRNGLGNITNAPLFVDYAGGDLRLQSNSPCINAGRNAQISWATDLDGHPPIVGGTVDIGAYGFQSPSSAISYAWLQQYELHVDGSADFTDDDADGMNNWQEWHCQTVPTNALSVLRLLSAEADGHNLKVTWQSVAGVDYFLERSTNLSASPRFTLLVTNIPGQAGTTSLTDSDASSLPQIRYRVGVRD